MGDPNLVTTPRRKSIEKKPLEVDLESQSQSQWMKKSKLICQRILYGLLFIILGYATLSLLVFLRLYPDRVQYLKSLRVANDSFCYQPPVLVSSTKEPFLDTKDISCSNFINSPEYWNESLARFQKVLRVPTVSYDDLGDVGEDDRWNIFGDLHDVFREIFPNIFEKLQVEYVATYGLLITYKGSNDDLKPLVLMAHQDVVPIAEATLDKWFFPPFSATYKDGVVYGRGATDDKNSLVAIFEVLELLASSDFTPERTVIASIGFDEEISGYHSALPLAKRLYEIYGQDGIELILDEGGFVSEYYGTYFAAVSVAEKGYMDVVLNLKTPGGHSSIPPPHTNIGIMSKLIPHIENPFAGSLVLENPFFSSLECFAKYSKDIDERLRTLILRKDTAALTDILSKDKETRYFFETSIAVDVIRGGVKVNALPEETFVHVNHRVSVEKNLNQLYDHYEQLVGQFAKENHLNLTVFDGSQAISYPDAIGQFSLSTMKTLEPSPVSPYGNGASAYEKLGGAIKYTFGNQTLVAPALMPANTDTRHYWNLTKSIYRWTPVSPRAAEITDDFNAHTVNENMPYQGHIDAITFYYNFIRHYD
ncbi:vacuolar carboxypeptidase [Schizosaccharomyces cryophilus OY26]|uniref:Vacuolar carboxypeptidase n=1 Tax=Schizosaccharomyces cryophilus (strain OY26 / ATCC MYA-4695 / CBS 11777 / NBRC 106824 / NRRL Y48691) TaxID=653667 RepID=S9XI67_SCHCR|nr:vacuolar carboxypeptidase [Schizosaccharomyces cryophilus OY26]EPY53336.1 vacuolar carboxypeptidase [Schizosaccharomyces cryophilus OY26]